MTVLTPTNAEELAQMIRAAQGPLRIEGGGSQGIAQRVAGTPLSLRGLSGIVEYAPGALTLIAHAGTPLAQIETLLAGEGQMLGFEPPDLRALLGTTGTPTIGGAIAANLSGPRRLSAGAARDALLGVRFVDGNGTALQNGGRVMKNVTGYDLVRLLAGARGTLGVIHEVALRVAPRPEAMMSLVLADLAPDQAVAAMAQALATPFQVSGAVCHQGQVRLRLEGRAEELAERCEKLVAALHAYRPEQDNQVDWPALRDLHPLRDAPGDIWRLHGRASDAPAQLDAIRPLDALLDWGGARLWLRLPEGISPRPALLPGAYAVPVRLADPASAPLSAPLPGIARLEAGLRARFDPRGLLNTGLLGD